MGLSSPVLIALIWFVGASACLLLFWGSKLTFLLDDWEFLLYRPGFNAHSILAPHGENIVVAPILIYKGLLATFGMGSALPFRVISTAIFLLSAVLLFVLLKRRVGQLPALAATAVVLFLGTAAEDLLWSFQVGYFGSLAAGLGMLLALERDDTRGDTLACLLLTVSILFGSLGLPFAAGALVQVLLRDDRWRRLYVVAIPLAVFAIWWLGWGHTAESALSLSNAAKTPRFVLDGLGAAVSAALGLSSPWLGLGPEESKWLFRILAVAVILPGLWRRRHLRRAPAWLSVTLAFAATFWILAGLNQMPGREPAASRYQYIGVIFVFLIAAELLRGVRFGPRSTVAIFAVAAFSVGSNLQFLNDVYVHAYHPISQLEKADLGALDIARDTVEPGFVLSEEVADTSYVHVEAGPYLAARESGGSPAYSDTEIAVSPPFARFAADKVLFGALRIGLAPAPASALPHTEPAPAEPNARGTVIVPAGGCLSVPSDGSVSPLLSLPPNGVVMQAGAPIPVIRMMRFETHRFPIEMGDGVAVGGVAEIAIPPDRSQIPWKVQLETTGPTTVCGPSSGSG